MADIELVKEVSCGERLKESRYERDDGAERVVFILQPLLPVEIKLKSESQPELALRHVFKQKPAGRRARRQQAVFLCPSLLCNLTDKAQ